MATVIRKTSEGLHPGTKIKEVHIVTALFPSTANLVDSVVFQSDGKYRIAQVQEVHATKGTDGAAVTLDLKKKSGLSAPFTDITVLGGTIDLKAAAATVQTASLSSTEANLIVNKNDRLWLDVTGFLTGVSGVQVTIVLIPLISNVYYRSPQK